MTARSEPRRPGSVEAVALGGRGCWRPAQRRTVPGSVGRSSRFASCSWPYGTTSANRVNGTFRSMSLGGRCASSGVTSLIVTSAAHQRLTGRSLDADDRSRALASLVDALAFRDAGEIGVQGGHVGAPRACGRPLRGPTLDPWLLSESGDP